MRALKVFLLLSSAPLLLRADSRGDQFVTAYLSNSLRRPARLTISVDYREAEGQSIHLEFAWMRKQRPEGFAHLIRLESPASEKGKLLLALERPSGITDYIAYRPNSVLKKKVRISGARQYKYKGLSISVQELIGGELGKYEHHYLGAQVFNGLPCHRIENRLRPQFKGDSNFPRSILLLRQDNEMPLHWELFDNNNRLEKVVEVDAVKRIEGVWTLTRARVQEVKRKGELKLELKQADYRAPLKDEWFSEAYLRRNSQ